MKNLQQEISILQKLNFHQNVIMLHDIQETANNYYMFMQYCNGGDLAELLRIRGRFSEIEARCFLSHIVNGFKAIHQMNVVHRDLKLANILINFDSLSIEEVLNGGNTLTEYKRNVSLLDNVKVVIADLGFAIELDAGEMA